MTDLLNTEAAVEVLKRRLPIFRKGRAVLNRITLLDAGDHSSGCVHYALEVQDAISGRASTQPVTIEALPAADLDAALSRLFRQIQASHPPAALGSFIGGDAEEALLIYPFPLDPRLDSLPLAVGAQSARARLLDFEWELVPYDCMPRVDVMRYKPGRRCKLSYTFGEPSPGAFTIIGKIFPDERGREAFESLTKVAGLYRRTAADGIIAPVPFTYLPDWKMVVREHISGTTLTGMARGGTATARHFARAAECIAVLHQGPLQVKSQHVLADELNLVARYREGMASRGMLDGNFESGYDRVLELASVAGDASLVPVHTNFNAGKLLVEGDRIALIDVDGLSLGYAEMDVAHFLSHLDLPALESASGPEMAQTWRETFLQTYESLAGPLNPVLLQFFKAAACFRLACRSRRQSSREAVAAGMQPTTGVPIHSRLV